MSVLGSRVKSNICKIKITVLLEPLKWEESRQAREMGWQESHEVQQEEVQSPAPGEEQPHAPVLAGGHPRGSSFVEKSRGSL